MNNNQQNLDQLFSNVYFNPIYAQIVLLLLANQEMTLQGIIKHVCSFSSQARRRDFEGTTFNYRHYVLQQKPIASTEQVNQRESQFCETFVRKYIEEMTSKYQDIQGNPNKRFLQTGIQDQMNTLLFQLKEDQLKNAQRDDRPQSKTQYLKKLILSLIERSSRNPDQEVADKIIKYGGVEVSLAHPLFAGDQNFRDKFKNILQNCNTFNELKKYGGEDISIVRSQLQSSISKCLISLKFDQQPAKQICEELLKNPMSHIVAGHQKLTNYQKESYYNSIFYKSQQLKQYSSIIGYEESLQFKVKQDIAKILSVIEEQLRVTRQILNHVLNFNIYPLLKVGAIRNIKQSVFSTIINECPNYLTAFKLVYYQKRSVESLREDPSINQRFDLAKVFFKTKLPFEEWKAAEDNILQRKYQIIDDLTLKLPSKSQLMQYILDVVEPYFHKQDKITDYRSDVELTLIQEIMETELSDLSFQNIQLIVNQTLDDPNYESSQAKNLSPSDKDCYNDRILKNEKFCTFKANKRRDIEEENYLQAIQLKKKIYKNNLEEKLNVYYEKVDQFVKEIIKNGGKIQQYESLVTNISKLFSDQKQQKPQADNKEKTNANSPQNAPRQVSREERLSKLSSLATEFVQAYVTKNKESYFQKYLSQKYGGDKMEYIKKLIETNAFENQSSNFFDNLGANTFLLKKVKAQFASNTEFATSELLECREIITMLTSEGGQQSQQMSRPQATVSKEQLEDEFRVEVKKFFGQYFKENEESILETILTDKYEKDTIKLAIALLQGKVFEKSEGPFFDNLGYNGHFLKKVKAEFKKNQAFVSTLLKASADIWSKIK